MPRKKLSEFRAKSLLNDALKQGYEGVQLDSQSEGWEQIVAELDNTKSYVIKVDQAEKSRFKKGLIKLDRQKKDVVNDVKELFSRGYRFLLVEPYKEHELNEERYLSIERSREGPIISYSKRGGIDVEAYPEAMKRNIYVGQAPTDSPLPTTVLEALIKSFEDNYFGFLELNPLLVKNDKLTLLDAAVEVDDEAFFFEDGWDKNDLRHSLSHNLSPEELAAEELAANSQASFSLEVINPNGSIFLLLSGGGASVVLADEVFNLGYGQQLANYGEYSGNPNLEETCHYTEQIIKILLKSRAKNKVLIIAGGVANFTDIRATFKGIIKAFQTYEDKLKQQSVKVFVRRGGPYQKEGLAAMQEFLEKAGIVAQVFGPELLLTDIISLAVRGMVK